MKTATSFLFLLVTFLGLYFSAAAESHKVYNVCDFGAVGDGKTLDAEAINRVISTCNAEGGGVVRLPPGTYFTTVVYLKSNVTLEVQEGATLLFSDDFNQYPIIESRWGGVELWGFTPLVYANDAQNVTITGKGVIDGNGKAWWKYIYPKDYVKVYSDGKLKKRDERIGRPVHIPGEPGAFPRPFLVEFRRCKNILIEGVTVSNSPCWTIHAVYCDGVTARNLTVLAPFESPNTDGFNPDSSKNVLVENCRFATGDDCIAIKSGRDEDGRRVGVPTENVTIRNCLLEGGQGICIGSEMSGGVSNVRVEDCIIKNNTAGIRVKTMRGRGGVVEDIHVTNVNMLNIRGQAIRINMFYHETPVEPVSERTPVFRDFHFRNITCERAGQAALIRGLPEMPISNISLENVSISTRSGFHSTDVRNIKLQNVEVSDHRQSRWHEEGP